VILIIVVIVLVVMVSARKSPHELASFLLYY
jgi:hypothetical protein